MITAPTAWHFMPCSLFLTLVILGCSSKAAPQRGHLMNLDEAGKRLAELAQQPLRPYSTRDFGREQFSEARSVVIQNDESMTRSIEIVESLRSELGPGLVVFIGCNYSLKQPPEPGNEIVVGLGKDQFDILRIAATDAANYDMSTEDLIKKLLEYDKKYGIEILQAGTDTVLFRLKSLPTNVRAFSEDVYKFCPDIVDQGVETIDALQKIVAEEKMVALWWD